MMSTITHVRTRRATLGRRFDVVRQLNILEETCVPSYLHRNIAAAAVAWGRLFAAEKMYRRFAPDGPVLDFGAASGELAHLLPKHCPYDFVELDETMAHFVETEYRGAARQKLETLEAGRYAAIFALDSLEHNDDYASILDALHGALRKDGVLILSGPTENALYRVGRWIAGFNGEYHKTTIRDIEREAGLRFENMDKHWWPTAVPLFSISCWRKRSQLS
jgi:2-polyprenyl-3-methyl-5-hydroxy-6-metoxy-1,4-benzoquinol methylase